MSKIFLDSNICIYAFDKTDNRKRQIAFELLRQFPCISSQVVIETYNACARKLKFAVEICDENTLFLCDITEVFEINAEVIKTAISFKKKYLLSFLDSCIAATAYHAKSTILYSEDMHHNLVIEGSLTIINPFL